HCQNSNDQPREITSPGHGTPAALHRPMPSMLHEILIDLIRENPEMLIPLLRDKLGTVDLRGGKFEPVERNYSQLPDLDADLVLQIRDQTGQLICALVLEVQLRPRRQKKYAWPSYQASTFRRLQCPTFVVVLAIKPSVARWADETIWTGQTHFRPIVIGPKQFPIILDPRHARENVAMAVLSGLAHPKEPKAEQIGEALWQALDRRSDQQLDPRHDLYWDQFLALIGETTRRQLMILLDGYRPQSEWGKKIYAEGESKGLLEGKREGHAAALTMLLQARGLSLEPAVRERIVQCRNQKTLHQWLRRAATAEHLDEVFES
ncbi:MAG: hypothetical protein AAGF11_47840, partial [Myxococcota bacterium]